MIRVLYKKTGDISYISHLDIVKLMERVSRRAGIKLAYSQGFSPHPKTSFSPALSVGMHSFCEYMDLELEDESIDLQELLDRYNEASVEGIDFVKAKKMEDSTGSIVAFLTNSVYEFDFEYYSLDDFEKIREAIEKISDEKEIMLERTSKSGNKIQYNIKEMIQKIEIYDDKKICCMISTSSSANLNPKVLLNHILDRANIIQDEVIRITKKDTFNISEDGTITRPI
ncbi:radical SAM-linked protein [Peptostreptococcaceae bacterium AS15]|nr:radical SAM-linked protein [Peptostreptococcaceae bacterium AS15]